MAEKDLDPKDDVKRALTGRSDAIGEKGAEKTDALAIPFHAEAYVEGGVTYVGYRHRLSAVEDADRRVVTKREAKKTLDTDLEEIERIVIEWFFPNARMVQNKARPINAYTQLPDKAKYVLIYLTFRLEPEFWDDLGRLAISYDWHYLGRLIENPEIAEGTAFGAVATRLHDLLLGRAKKPIIETLKDLPMVGHRALAEEYANLIGVSLDNEPSDNIQDRMLMHRTPYGEGLSALCLSGGGIRSASFCLGAIQVLAKNKLFGRFDYLSTVSGGGYIGTGLTRWMFAKRQDLGDAEGALAYVETDLGRWLSADYVAGRVRGRPFEAEGPLTWLRMHTNYLSRQLSLFSADAWTIVATYFRNLLIVWMMFWPWVAIFLLVPWFTVWLGRFPHAPPFESLPIALAIVGTIVGVIGASYLFQGTREQRHANGIAWPDEGDTRAALGATMLLLASFAVAYVFSVDADALSDWGISKMIGRYWYLAAAIVLTQLVLASRVVHVADRKKSYVWAAACVGSLVQLTLIYALGQVIDQKDGRSYSSNLYGVLRSLLLPVAILIALLVGEIVKAALRSIAESPDRREHQARTHGFIVMLITAWIFTAALVVLVPPSLSALGPSVPGAVATGSGITLSLSVQFGYGRGSPGKPDARTPLSLTVLGTLGMILLTVLIALLAWKAIAAPPHEDVMLCWASVPQCMERSFTDHLNAELARVDADGLWMASAFLVVSAALMFFVSNMIRMNEFSLHGFYRDRLIRAFYGAFRGNTFPRKPELFTGFDVEDDIKLHQLMELYPEGVPKSTAEKTNKPPFLVVNTALNLVKGEALAWQERKADSFTFTALRAGNYRLGYRDVVKFAEGVRLGTAMAISGAAFNPNMGYNSSGAMSFLMSFFNVRLGWWLGNPGREKWESKDPTWSSWRLLQEAGGETTDRSSWVHLSDGGHFDNMGLWEMIHRRCRKILVIDASQDKMFCMEDFYTVVRKIRIDMGIDIEPVGGPVMLFPRSARSSGQYFARFRIGYSSMNGGKGPLYRDGTILYLKPCVYGREPLDVLEYAEKHPDFPHETTTDQFFSESQFESYRKLGEWEMKKLLETLVGNVPNARDRFESMFDRPKQ